MLRFDGSERPSKHPTVVLVFFEENDDELKGALLGSLEHFFHQFKGELPAHPRVSLRDAQNPGNIPTHNQDRAFFPAIEEINGNIVIGVTETGFYDPSLSRCVFSYGSWSGRGLLSTCRFRTGSPGRRLFLDRLSKQIIKTLALACGLSSCSRPDCIVSYHRWVEDLDRNHGVCDTCRSAFIRSLSGFLKQDDGGDEERAYA